MNKLRITVLRTDLREDLAKEYGVENFSKCDCFEPGQVFECSGIRKPEGFCAQAWQDIFHYLFCLTHGGAKETFFNNTWVRQPGVSICACTDGIRPVTFKVEALDEQI